MTGSKSDDLILFRVEWVEGYGDAPIEYKTLDQLQNADDGWDALDDFFIRVLRNSNVGEVNSWSDPSGRIDFLKVSDPDAKGFKHDSEHFGTVWITDATVSECGRFDVDPEEYYGLKSESK